MNIATITLQVQWKPHSDRNDDDAFVIESVDDVLDYVTSQISGNAQYEKVPIIIADQSITPINTRQTCQRCGIYMEDYETRSGTGGRCTICGDYLCADCCDEWTKNGECPECVNNALDLYAKTIRKNGTAQQECFLLYENTHTRNLFTKAESNFDYPIYLLQKSLQECGLFIEFVGRSTENNNKIVSILQNGDEVCQLCIEGDNPAQTVKDLAQMISL